MGIGRKREHGNDMREKVDFLKECMNDPALTKAGPMPIDIFNSSYCIICANRECSRSGLSSSSFDIRAMNWKKDLFDSVPRADELDPNYNRIREKRFLTVQRDVLEISSQTSIPAEKFAVSIQETPMEKPSNTIVDSTVSTPQILSTPQTPPAHVLEPENTPFVQGTILPGGVPSPSKEKSTDTILEPGGTYVFGESK